MVANRNIHLLYIRLYIKKEIFSSIYINFEIGRYSQECCPISIFIEGVKCMEVYYKPSEAAKFLNVSKITIKRWKKDGKIVPDMVDATGHFFYSQSQLLKIKSETFRDTSPKTVSNDGKMEKTVSNGIIQNGIKNSKTVSNGIKKTVSNGINDTENGIKKNGIKRGHDPRKK